MAAANRRGNGSRPFGNGDPPPGPEGAHFPEGPPNAANLEAMKSGTEPPIQNDAMQITVRTEYMPTQSNPQNWRYVFVYHIRIENVGEEPAQLFWRHWRIHDPVAGDHEVQGEGVVGETPWLGPGEVHEYNSFCVLRGAMGHMDGFYHFRRPDGSVFRSPVPRFFLQAPPGATGPYLA